MSDITKIARQYLADCPTETEADKLIRELCTEIERLHDDIRRRRLRPPINWRPFPTRPQTEETS